MVDHGDMFASFQSKWKKIRLHVLHVAMKCFVQPVHLKIEGWSSVTLQHACLCVFFVFLAVLLYDVILELVLLFD